MTSQPGLTADQALARIMTAERIAGEKERRQEYREILGEVHSHGYREGSEDGYEEAAQNRGGD